MMVRRNVVKKILQNKWHIKLEEAREKCNKRIHLYAKKNSTHSAIINEKQGTTSIKTQIQVGTVGYNYRKK